MNHARRQAHPSPAPARLAPVGAPWPFIASLPCGCENGYVTAFEPGTATWYSEGREVWVRCPDCHGAGTHELRGIANGPRFAEVYPDLADKGGYLCARVTDSDPVRLAWAPTLEDAKAWKRVDDWHPTPLQDGALLACLGLSLEVRR